MYTCNISHDDKYCMDKGLSEISTVTDANGELYFGDLHDIILNLCGIKIFGQNRMLFAEYWVDTEIQDRSVEAVPIYMRSTEKDSDFIKERGIKHGNNIYCKFKDIVNYVRSAFFLYEASYGVDYTIYTLEKLAAMAKKTLKESDVDLICKKYKKLQYYQRVFIYKGDVQSEKQYQEILGFINDHHVIAVEEKREKHEFNGRLLEVGVTGITIECTEYLSLNVSCGLIYYGNYIRKI